MSRGVQPKKVAPLIRGARYSFLVAGWFYGTSKMAVFRKIEAIERPKRKAAYEAEENQKLKIVNEKILDDIRKLFKEIDYEPEPGWENLLIET